METINDIKQIMNTIENKYLIQNKNGTFELNPKVYELYSKNLVDKIKFGMKNMNKAILLGAIKFKMNDENGVNKVQVIYKNNEKLIAYFTKGNSADPELFSVEYNFLHSYCSEFGYSWAGFWCYVNEEGCALLHEAISDIAEAISIGKAIAVVSGEVELALGMKLVLMYMDAVETAFYVGARDGGATMDCWGSPMGVYVIYGALPVSN
ncbi:MAG: hypothetical protein ACRC41_10395 [Sarcina sp.]